jgi:hypothetical protein
VGFGVGEELAIGLDAGAVQAARKKALRTKRASQRTITMMRQS